ncbi:MAG: 1,2-phenylacetyl-CoA epoxidase subunit B, partial [Ferruginibacter sp.]
MNIQIRKFYYGDIPEETTGSNEEIKSSQIPPSGGGGAFPLWEVFIRSKQGLDHKHAGSLHAADASMAIENARDVYTRRQEG